jgi:hypothetical protein
MELAEQMSMVLCCVCQNEIVKAQKQNVLSQYGPKIVKYQRSGREDKAPKCTEGNTPAITILIEQRWRKE